MNETRYVNSEPSIEVTDYDVELEQLTATDIIQYSFNYVGVLTGQSAGSVDKHLNAQIYVHPICYFRSICSGCQSPFT